MVFYVVGSESRNLRWTICKPKSPAWRSSSHSRTSAPCSRCFGLLQAVKHDIPNLNVNFQVLFAKTNTQKLISHIKQKSMEILTSPSPDAVFPAIGNAIIPTSPVRQQHSKQKYSKHQYSFEQNIDSSTSFANFAEIRVMVGNRWPQM
jgi:hypothetical protein